MKVYIIGAGPGAADLITVRGAERLRRCPVVIHMRVAPDKEMLNLYAPDAEVHDMGPWDLEEMTAVVEDARARDLDVAVLHNGDTCLYSALPEETERLDALSIPWEVIPGVSAFSAAAARLGVSYTRPGMSQTLILTRVGWRTSLPEGEQIADLARHRSSMAVFMGVKEMESVADALLPHYGEAAPVAVLHRVSRPDESVETGTLADIVSKIRGRGWKKRGIILVGDFLPPGGRPFGS